MAAGSTPEQMQKIIDRFVPQANGCWHLGTTKPNDKGYSTTKLGWPVAKTVKGHVISWMYHNGDIPAGMVLDHICHDPAVCAGGNTCEHRKCVNPEHLRLVTEAENSQRTVRLLKFRTHCKNGHTLKDNIYVYSSGKRRGCATCMNRPVKVGV